MSFDFPASVQQDIQQYARAEQISPDAAAVKLVQAGLKATKRKAASSPLTDADWDKLKEIDPGFAFFEKMPERLLDTIESTSRRIRTERLSARA